MGMVLAGFLLVPGVVTLWTAWQKFTAPARPSPLALSLAGAGVLAVNLSCALTLARYRQHSGSLTRAARCRAGYCEFTDTELARIGLGETDARA